MCQTGLCMHFLTAWGHCSSSRGGGCRVARVTGQEIQGSKDVICWHAIVQLLAKKMRYSKIILVFP